MQIFPATQAEVRGLYIFDVYGIRSWALTFDSGSVKNKPQKSPKKWSVMKKSN